MMHGLDISFQACIILLPDHIIKMSLIKGQILMKLKAP